MKTILLPAAAFGCAMLAGLSAYAFTGSDPDTSSEIELAGSSDGAGLPGFPGGRGGKSGRELAREYERRPSRYSGATDNDRGLVAYCIDVLKNNGRAKGSDDYRFSDCAEYFEDLDSGRGRRGESGRRGADGRDGREGRDGRDGASVDGGVGGQGGRAGAGAGGGRGGGGGAGVGGGVGGAGGRGGGSY